MHSRPLSALASQRGLRLFVQAAVSISLVCWLLTRFDLSRSLHVVSQARVAFIAAGFLSSLVLLPTLAARFSAVLAKGVIPLRGPQVLAIIWIGQFWNFFLPGSTGGDVYRLGTLWSRYPERKADALVAVFVDRLVPTAILALGAAIGLLFLPPIDLRGLAAGLHLPAFIPYALCGALVIAAVAISVPLIFHRVVQLVKPVLHRLLATRVYWRPDSRLACIAGWSILGHLINFFAFFFFARAVGLPITFLQVCCFLPLVLLFLILPISINGHGVREVLLVALFHSYGIVTTSGATLPETVIALSIVGLSSDLILGVAGALIFVGSRVKDSSRTMSETPAI